MSRSNFDLELFWMDPNGVCHNLLVHRFRCVAGDQVDVRLKFIVLGDDLQPLFDPDESEVLINGAR